MGPWLQLHLFLRPWLTQSLVVPFLRSLTAQPVASPLPQQGLKTWLSQREACLPCCLSVVGLVFPFLSGCPLHQVPMGHLPLQMALPTRGSFPTSKVHSQEWDKALQAARLSSLWNSRIAVDGVQPSSRFRRLWLQALLHMMLAMCQSSNSNKSTTCLAAKVLWFYNLPAYAALFDLRRMHARILLLRHCLTASICC